MESRFRFDSIGNPWCGAGVGPGFFMVHCANNAALKMLSLFLLALVLPLRAHAAPERPTLWIDGDARHALVFVPTRGEGPSPLVFVYPGAGDTADNFIEVGFQDAMLAELHKRYSIDDSRVYANGFSNGARMVYLFWATRPKVFAAFAPVAGMPSADIAITEPKPVLHVGGRADHTNEFAEQMKSVELARAVNKATRTPVETYIHDGGHYWPSDTTGRIVAFLRTQALSR